VLTIRCDATWEQYCGRNLTTIRSILVDNDQTDLLSYMDIYWKSDRNGDDYLWTHVGLIILSRMSVR
jgi:hypothetical protein